MSWADDLLVDVVRLNEVSSDEEKNLGFHIDLWDFGHNPTQVRMKFGYFWRRNLVPDVWYVIQFVQWWQAEPCLPVERLNDEIKSPPSSSCGPSIARIHSEQGLLAFNVQPFEEFRAGYGAIALIIDDRVDLDRSFFLASRVDVYKQDLST